MPLRTTTSGSELFIVDNSDTDWKVLKYLHDWCAYCAQLDVASAYFEIGSLLALGDEWQKMDAPTRGGHNGADSPSRKDR